MANSSLPLDIKNLLTECIESVSQLEALFAFYKNPAQTWTVASLSKELRSNETSAAKHIMHMLNCGFIKQIDDQHFIYSPQTEKLTSDVEMLHQVFQEKSVAVIAYLYEKPNDKLKGFANAFKIKKD